VENRRQIGRIFDDEILDDNESDIVRARWPVCRGAIRFINYDGLLGNAQVLHHSLHRTGNELVIINESDAFIEAYLIFISNTAQMLVMIISEW
jgi:hypothetical protein